MKLVTYVTEWHKENSRICRKKRLKRIFFRFDIYFYLKWNFSVFIFNFPWRYRGQSPYARNKKSNPKRNMRTNETKIEIAVHRYFSFSKILNFVTW